MARYLVSGGCGFIGSHLVDALLGRGDRVTVFDDLSSGAPQNLASGADLEEGSVTDAARFATLAGSTDGIFHLAAISSVEAATREPERTRRVNLGGTENALAAAALRNVPIIIASSAAVYGDAGDIAVTEDQACAPLSRYGEDKRAGELAALKAAQAGLEVTAIRPFNAYGPRQSPASPYAGVISRFISKCLAGAPLRIDGDGGQSRDFIYVADLVRLLLAAQDSKAPRPALLNGCTGRATTISTLARTVAESCGHDPVFERGPARTGDIRYSRGAPERATRLLGFRAETGLTEGLKQTVDWQRLSAGSGA